jgi:toxin ParE1/3/4
MKLVATAEAAQRLAEIRDYVARDNPAASLRLVARLLDRAEALARFPQLGRVVPEYQRDEQRELVEDGYRIVYRATPNEVQIVTVFEGHRLLRDEEIG